MKEIILICRKIKKVTDSITDILAYIGVIIGMISILPVLGAWGLAFLILISNIFIVKLAIIPLIKWLNRVEEKTKSKMVKPHRYKLLKLTEILFSERIQKTVFEPTMGDWDVEIFEAIKNRKELNLFAIHIRNTYTFLAAIWMKSPIGDLIEFIQKFAKL